MDMQEEEGMDLLREATGHREEAMDLQEEDTALLEALTVHEVAEVDTDRHRLASAAEDMGLHLV